MDYQKAVFGTVNWLLKKNRPADAHTLLGGAGTHDPDMLTDPRTKRFHDSLLGRIEAAESAWR